MPKTAVVAFLPLLLCPLLGAGSIGSGTITGTFINPSPACTVPISCTGAGTNLIFLGDGGNANFMFYTGPTGTNGWDFTNQEQGVPFDLGSITLNNGETVLFTSPTSLVLHLQSESTDPVFNVSLDLAINYVITPNVGGNDFADADFFYFPDYPQFGSFRVLEHQVGFVTLQGAFNSLDFLGFGRVGNPDTGFLSTSLVASPEPSTYALLGGALLSLFGLRRRKRQA